MKQWWQVFGSTPKGEGELLVGSEVSKVLQVQPGDTLTIRGESFTVSGVLDQTGSQDDSLVFASLGKAQKLLGKQGKITLVEVAALCSGCPIGDMVTQIAEKLPDAKVTAIQQVVAGRLKALDQFRRFSYAMSAVVLFIGSLIVFITMMGSVNERTVEIGLFRAIGFRKSHIMRIILLEAALVSLLAGLLGLLSAWVAPGWPCPIWRKTPRRCWSGTGRFLWVQSVCLCCWGCWPAFIRHCMQAGWTRQKRCGHCSGGHFSAIPVSDFKTLLCGVSHLPLSSEKLTALNQIEEREHVTHKHNRSEKAVHMRR